MYCSTRPDTFSPSPLTASMPAPLAAAPGTALSNLRCQGARREAVGRAGRLMLAYPLNLPGLQALRLAPDWSCLATTHRA